MRRYPKRRTYTRLLQQALVDALNSLIPNKNEVLQAHADIIEALTETADPDREHTRLKSEQDVVVGLMQRCVVENAYTALDQEDHCSATARCLNATRL